MCVCHAEIKVAYLLTYLLPSELGKHVENEMDIKSVPFVRDGNGCYVRIW